MASIGASDGLIKRQMQGAVMVLLLNRPPVNALDARLIAALRTALAEAEADTEVRAIVLAAEGAQFSAGLDVSELGRVAGAALPGLVAQIEGLRKPVVAAVQGNALGGATEVLLACHARVAHEGARLGLPEVALGLMPVTGATQRLPRLVGAPVALNILLEGKVLSAIEALAMGLLDAVVEDAPLARALVLAEGLVASAPVKTSDRRDGMRDPVAYQNAIAEARKRIEGWRLPAPAGLVDCVEAAQLLPFDMGLRFEQSHAEAMAETPEAAALRYAFLAEKRALFPPAALTAHAPPKLGSLAILGTGGLAPDVARQALGAGFKVRLVATDRAGLTAALQAIAARQEAMVAAGQLSAAAREADWARLTGVLASDGVESADLILATPEAPRLADLPAPVVSLGGRGGFVLHASPMVGGLATLAVAPDVSVPQQALVLALGRRLGWKVMVQGAGSALDQRLRLTLSRAIAVLESKGHQRATIAAALASYGLGAGGRMRLPAAPDNTPEILSFCMAALMNEGGKILSEGAALRPSDVDAAALLTGLFPRWEGGPLYQADRTGLMAVRADLRRRAEASPQLFTPAAVFDRLIGEGRRFEDLNRG